MGQIVMEKLKCSIGLLACILLIQSSSHLANADNSTIIVEPTNSSTSSNVSISANSSEFKQQLNHNSTGNATDTSEASKKDKRQAQRGYTDIPIDEGPFDEIANSSPPPLPAYSSDLPVFAERADEFPGSYLPENSNKLDRKPESSFFAPRLGFPSSLPKLDDVPAAAATIQERRDDFFDSTDGKPIPGEAGRDYPVFSQIPRTSFSCKDQQWPGYYADTESRCQVFWICQKHRMDAFLCPNGTLFNQQVFVCDWWFNVDCNGSPEFYSRNQFLYQGPGIGIDGKPTRFRGPSGPSPSSSLAVNSFSNAIIPRPSGVNSNSLVNQVQSSNQIARVATITQQSPTLKPTSSFYDASIASSTNNNQQQFSGSKISQAQQSLNKFQSTQSMLTNRMQKSSTGRPQFESTTGGYSTNQLSQNSQSDFDKRGFLSTSSSSGNNGGRSSSFQDERNLYVSTTRRPEPIIIQTSLRPPSPTPRINVNIDTSKSNKQLIGTIGSTGRPTIRVNTDIPLFSQGSSTLRTPKDIVNQFRESSARLIGSSQNVYNTTATITGRPSNPTTQSPITTTFRSTTTSYSSNQGFIPSTPQNNFVSGNQFGPGPLKSEYGTPSSTPRPPPISTNTAFPTAKYGPPTVTPTAVSAAYGAPGHTPGTPQGYVDRNGFQKETRNQFAFVSSTAIPFTSNSNGLERRGFHGQRSNQFSNINGQREIMYSPSQNAYVEYPYSPSQQKNKQRLLELQASKGISTPAKDIFAYPHFHGQRSNAFSDGDSVSYISNNNKQVTINHAGHSQRKNPFSEHQHGSNGVQQTSPLPILNSHPPLHQQHQNQQQHLQNQLPINTPQQQNNLQNSFNNVRPQQVFSQQSPQASQNNPHQNHNNHNNYQNFPQQQQINNHQNNQQFNSGPQNIQQSSQHVPQIHNPNQIYNNQNQIHQQYHQQIQPPLQNNFAVNNRHNQFSGIAAPTQNTPFHERIIHVPSQNLQLPSSIGSASPDGYTSIQSGSFISIATAAPFSKQILKHSAQKKNHNHKNTFVTTQEPFSFSTPNNLNSFISPPAPHPTQDFSSVSLSTTLRPPPVHSTAAPFTNDAHAFSKNARNAAASIQVFSQSQPTPHSNQNGFIAAPTQASLQTTSPGHRQNPYLPHNHGKRDRHQNKNQAHTNGHQHQQPQYQHNQNQGIQFPNSVITTTIKYPEGTGSLRIGIPNSGSNKKQIVDFSYSANPKSKSSQKISTPNIGISTTPQPTVTERFNQIVSSTTLRPLNPSSPSPHPFKDSLRRSSGTRLAGAIINKSTSSSNAIYVDTSATAESVSTPVSVSPSASPSSPVATSNFGLRISTTAKKRMAGAWQNYFNGNEKENPELAN